MKLFLRVAGCWCMLLSILATTGCTRYFANRYYDFRDTFAIGAGVTAENPHTGIIPPSLGVYVQVTDFLHLGAITHNGYSAELDLRGRLTHLRLHLTEPDGTELERVFAHVVPAPWPEGSGWLRAGRLDLVVPREARELLIRPQGYPPRPAELVDGLQELRCGPRIEGGADAAAAVATRRVR